MPCTTSSFTDAQRVAGYPRYPLNAGSAPPSRTSRSASRSRSAVVTPGATAASSAASTSPRAGSAARIFAISAADRQHNHARPSHHRGHRRGDVRRHGFRRLIPVDRPERRPRLVELDERLAYRARRPADARAPPRRCRRAAVPAPRRTWRTPSGPARRSTRTTRKSAAGVSRSTSVSSGTSIFTTTMGVPSSSIVSSARACVTVRGNPSSTNPAAASGLASRSRTMPIIRSSPTN